MVCCQKVDRIDASRLKPNASAIWVYCFLIIGNPVLGAHSSFWSQVVSGRGRVGGRIEVEIAVEAVRRSRPAAPPNVKASKTDSSIPCEPRGQPRASPRATSRSTCASALGGTHEKVSDAVRSKSGRIPPSLRLDARKALASALTLRSVSGTRGAELFGASRARRRVSSFALVQGPVCLPDCPP